jgi:hypothetical protein
MFSHKTLFQKTILLLLLLLLLLKYLLFDVIIVPPNRKRQATFTKPLELVPKRSKLNKLLLNTALFSPITSKNSLLQLREDFYNKLNNKSKESKSKAEAESRLISESKSKNK